jgi:hypothetical protein
VTASLDFGNPQLIRDGRRCLYRHVDSCIDQIGGLNVAAEAADCRRQDLRDALSDREGRRFPVEWGWAIALVAPERLRAQVAACLVEPLGYGIAPIRPLTVEERLARLEYRVVTELGPAGMRLVEESRR